ncbi:D-amino acid dehydrogenase [Marinobacterium weihaiense]|uniref:D-amino acid dehydrogenase n=1 Tax=Marinobacterium weihaiense TaxID=2851016 RepID=A0ABS6M9I4_9GAMM|nr:D-amino acid dehydrogenase [Marinobacterium weihaiense]MBV0932943.1 D-amino acid dehydrogenase [Marinobacterium weihaiense]
MRILILGSGVIGVTSAWYLAQAGHEVVVVERQPGPALETSHANAGQISPGYSAPWAAPGVPLKAIKWLMQDLAPLRISPRPDLNTLGWLARMLANCNHRAYTRNKLRMLRIAEYSRDCLIELRNEIGIEYDHRAQGLIQLFRSQQQLEAAAADMRILDRCGVAYELLDMAGVAAHEPALARVSDKLVGGLRLLGDETGDCYLFTRALARRCEALGVEFRFGTEIDRLLAEAGRVSGVATSAGVLKGDACLVALGSYSPTLLAPLGIKAPIYPVKGYSLTIPITDPACAPESTVMDETYKVAVSRLGDRIRVGGTAELNGFDLSTPDSRRINVEHVVKDLFPGSGDAGAAELWTGLRPMTPDGTPILGATAYPGLYLNTGHGTLGWTLSLGSARYISDIIDGRTPAIDTEGLSINRYSR